jgi:UDP-N-acetylmuramoyl-L-alanyl-D-glutamate--2,6-diaminopimelate ligase
MNTYRQHNTAIRLSRLLENIDFVKVSGSASTEITGMAYDSRQVRDGYLFIALSGSQSNGINYINEAISRGAVAVLVDQEYSSSRDINVIQVQHARKAMADMAHVYYDFPDKRLSMWGITGTNGKTTISFLIKSILEKAGWMPGLIGTIQYEIGSRWIPANRTTPESPDILSLLQQMVHIGCKSVVMEVSSHALEQDRVHGFHFDIAVFSNLTRDHLDYHGDIQTYYKAKKKLFDHVMSPENTGIAIINMDDDFGKQLIHDVKDHIEVITYGFHPDAMIRALEPSITKDGCEFIAHTQWGDFPVHIALPGRFNMYNALAAIGACVVKDIDCETIQAGLASLTCVPGRLEKVSGFNEIDIYIDYAHTDDALYHVLTSLREVCKNKLIVVFGCGGDRDKTKRPLMGKVASIYADYAIITSDNPRSENPDYIIQEIVSGMEKDNYEIEKDREKAIIQSLEIAQAGDIVLIAGKGHENHQEINHMVIPFDDREVVERLVTMLK